MMNWFECKVSYDKVGDNGMPKKVSEAYLVDAMSFTEAEARITKEISPFVSMGEFSISNIKRAKIAEIFDSPDENDDRYYRAKVLYVSFDEKSGAEKKSPAVMIVKSGALEGAVKRLVQEMDKTLATYEIASVTDTTIMDIYPFEQPEK